MEKDRGTRGAGLDRHRLEAALNLVRREVESGFLPAVSAAVYFHGERVAALCAGHCDPETKRLPVHAASPFLVASLTKPVVCAAAMLLVEEGRFTLEEPACRYVPELAGGGKEGILIRHLFTHTSGLPDQLPEGTELRKRHVARAEFVRAVCDCAPLFAPEQVQSGLEPMPIEPRSPRAAILFHGSRQDAIVAGERPARRGSRPTASSLRLAASSLRRKGRGDRHGLYISARCWRRTGRRLGRRLKTR